jgi:F-box protein 9
MNPTEAELERFRREWKEEVSAKTKKQTKSTAASSRAAKPIPSKSTTATPPKTQQPAPSVRPLQGARDVDDEVVPAGYHDLDEKHSGRRLDAYDEGSSSSSSHEPKTALEHYEKAVEKEGQGSLGDSLSLYRKAFRMDSNVDKKYKNKHFPPSAYMPPKPSDPNPSNAPVTVPNTAHHSLTAFPPTVAELISDFSDLSILGEPAPTDLSPPPPCPISNIPDEILTQILLCLATGDVTSFSRLALVCKRLAFLVLTEDTIWKRIVHGQESGFPTMHYHYACTILGNPIETSTLEEPLDESLTVAPSPRTTTLSLTSTYPTYRQMFRLRPRIRFNGCYISTVNYTRPGATAATSVTWNSPVLIVTYYRYLRFFRDGSLISLLTTSEPSDVVPYLLPEHVHQNHTGTFPQSVMKDALKGRWRLSGDPWKNASADEEPVEPEGNVIIETEGVVPKYMYKMHLALGSAGKSTRNNKLTWRGYWSWNRLTDDWAEFGLKNDRAFYWSRVRSFGTSF